MGYNNILVEFRDQIAILTINRPESLNALNTSVLQELSSVLDELKEKQVRVCIITGAGKAFVAGADISEMVGKGQAEGEAFGRFGQSVFQKITQMPYIVIAAVNGYALGGGCELAMACDIRIASENARFGQPEVKLGLIPGFGGNIMFTKLLGVGHALFYLTTADMLDANEAYSLGLVQKVVPSQSLLDECLNISQKILSQGKTAIQKVKEVVWKTINLPIEEALNIEAKEFGKLFDNVEAKEGMRAFLEKRKPNW